MHHLVKGLHLKEMAAARIYLFAAVHVHPVVKGDHQGLGEVDKAHASAAITPFAWDRHLYATDAKVTDLGRLRKRDT